MHDFIPYLPWLGGLVGLGCLAAAFCAGRRRRLVDNLPTSKTTGVFIGLVELQVHVACSPVALCALFRDFVFFVFSWFVCSFLVSDYDLRAYLAAGGGPPGIPSGLPSTIARNRAYSQS